MDELSNICDTKYYLMNLSCVSAEKTDYMNMKHEWTNDPQAEVSIQ